MKNYAETKRAWYLRNREAHLAKSREWRKANLEERRAVQRAYNKAYNQRPEVRLRRTLRTRLKKALKGSRAAGTTLELLGCSIEQLRAHLEAQFKPGMNWDNWTRDGWHIDHVRPLASFDLADPEQQRAACHYSNLQPLWAIDNLAKGGRF